ncbi:hypothetical protein W01_13280 [Candidatus Nitrotoga sp. AM1P]|nr:hypothetical protein W01_13280 [Candidatus Nitrotoga sp. AM1P]
MKIRHEKIIDTAFCFLKEDAKRLFVYIGNVIDDFRLSSFSSAKRVLLIGMTFGVMTTAVAENVTIHPANPKSLESVVVKIEVGSSCLYDPRVPVQLKQVGTVIRVDLIANPDCADFGVPFPVPDLDIKLGQFPPGVFSVDVFRTYKPSTGIAFPAVQLGSAQFTVTDSYASKTGPFPLVDYTDHWWNPQESGMGFSIMQHPSDRIFAAWFVYDQAGQPIWYTLQPGQWLSPTAYSGPIYKTTGTYLGVTYDPGQLVVTPVGTGTFIFHDYSSATFNYTVDGITGTKEITRLSF